ncbi:unnamed protein product [Ceratitis capitata]|uniref:(Mediterranean fruit fly) hypothetical protein n=1 Tax=Ceratitis capitata TaxID=7213 RepID=A0A811VCN4_CERCA|nr:unnamed protein product [Ceratitis capitata]
MSALDTATDNEDGENFSLRLRRYACRCRCRCRTISATCDAFSINAAKYSTNKVGLLATRVYTVFALPRRHAATTTTTTHTHSHCVDSLLSCCLVATMTQPGTLVVRLSGQGKAMAETETDTETTHCALLPAPQFRIALVGFTHSEHCLWKHRTGLFDYENNENDKNQNIPPPPPPPPPAPAQAPATAEERSVY